MDRAAFLKAAIDDCQAVIRALDAKSGAVLVFLLAPVASIGKIFRTLEAVPGPYCVRIGVGVIFFGLWAAAALSVLRAVSPLGSPADHIPDGQDFKGAFFRGGLFRFGYADALFRRSVITARSSVSTAVEALPATDEEIVRELAFEHFKLCFIREMKMKLVYWSVNLAIAWLALALAIYVVARYAR